MTIELAAVFVVVAACVLPAAGDVYRIESTSSGAECWSDAEGGRGCPNMSAAIDAAAKSSSFVNWTTFVFDSGTHVVDRLLTLPNSQFLSLSGNSTRLRCTGVRSGLAIGGPSREFRVENVTFDACAVDVQNVVALTIVNSTFVDTPIAGLHLVNVSDVSIRSCKFQSGSSGVKINVTSQRSVIDVADSLFSDLISDKLYSYGSGIQLWVHNGSSQINATVSNTTFKNDVANSGGAFSLTTDQSSSSRVTVRFEDNVRFINCTANTVPVDKGRVEVDGNGGAVALVFLGSGDGTISFDDVTFDLNRAKRGSALFVSYGGDDDGGPVVVVDRCQFYRNVAIVHGAIHVYNVSGQRHPIEIVDTQFRFNHIRDYLVSQWVPYKGSALVLVNTIAILDGRVEFERNNNSAVALFDAWLRLNAEASVNFTENRGTKGGALYLNSGSALQAYDSASIGFYRNNATGAGGAVFVDDTASLLYVSSLLGNRLCFMRSYPVAGDVVRARAAFVNNTAGDGGDAIFASNLDVCRWLPDGRFDVDGYLDVATTWPHLSFSPNQPRTFASARHGIEVSATLTAALSNEDNDAEKNLSILCVGGHSVDRTGDSCSVQAQRCNETIYSGVAYNLTITTKAQHVFVRGCGGLYLSRYYTQAINAMWTDRFDVFFVSDQTWTLIYFAGPMGAENSLVLEVTTEYGGKTSFQLQMPTNCAMGHALVDDKKGTRGCMCELPRWLNHRRILACNWAGGLLPFPGYWIGQDPNQKNMTSKVGWGWCPVGYCHCNESDGCWFDVRKQDRQCSYGRSGVLCGNCSQMITFGWYFIDCRNETHCPKVNNRVPGLGAVLGSMIAITLVVVFLVILIDFDVTYGFIPPLIFYFQIVGFTLSSSPNSGLFTQTLIRYLVWLPNLSLPIKWCLSSMSALQSIALLYIIPASVFVFMVLFALLARRMARVARIHVLRPFWSLVTLTYVGIAYTTTLLLHCVPLGDGVDGYRWYMDATVKCFGPDHWRYGVLGLAVLAFYVIPFPLFVAFGMRRFPRFHALTDVTQQAFKPRYYWGEGFNLGRRFVIIVVHCYAAINGETFRQTTILIVLIILSAIHGQLQLYKGKWLNSFEIGLLGILCILSASQIYSYNPPLPIYFADTLFALPYVAAFAYFVYFVCVRVRNCVRGRRRRSGQLKRGETGSIVVRYNKKRAMTAIDMPGRERTSADMSASSSLPRSFDRDVLMDESKLGLREPLLELPTDQCQGD
ncbi:uncharacterized protein [Oscarella lobularis]|uniref:uncharacterized protein n=1 Tax=Oscarella lobularis TaxID=121494 RepID=UPI0033139E22